MKKALFIIASKDFRDEEYFIPYQRLKDNGFEVVTAGDKAGLALGTQGGEAEIRLDLKEVNPKEFDAVIFVGGGGALKYLDNEDSYRIARETSGVLAAICIAPLILARAGILKGKSATVWTSSMDKSPVGELEKEGVNYSKEDLVIDGKIITANGPLAASKFADVIDTIVKKG